jgi:hypothetical protein
MVEGFNTNLFTFLAAYLPVLNLLYIIIQYLIHVKDSNLFWFVSPPLCIEK